MRYGIVASGGGISCAYSVGVSLAFVELGLTNPDFIICSSGSAGTFAYWTAGQYDSVRNIWENLLPGKRFVSMQRLNKIMDIDYLIDDIFKKQDPLFTDRVKDSKINLYIGATTCSTGEGHYFLNHDSVDFFEILRASMALPIAYNRQVVIGDNKYIDGDLSLTLASKISKAKEFRFDNLLVIDNENNSILNGFFLWIYSLFCGNALGLTIRNNLRFAQVPKSPEIIYLKPSRKLPTATINNSQASIKQVVKIGFSDAMENAQLIELAKKC